jgi:hypothetical protein
MNACKSLLRILICPQVSELQSTWAQDERPADLHTAQPNVPVSKTVCVSVCWQRAHRRLILLGPFGDWSFVNAGTCFVKQLVVRIPSSDVFRLSGQ